MLRVAGGARPLPYLLLLAAATAVAQERVIPFWPNEVPAAIHAEVDGVAVLETVRELSRFHRVQGSPGFAAAAEHMRKKALAAGLADAAVERFPADGQTRYAHFRSYLGWDPRSATLEEISPIPRLHASFPEMPVSLADYSQDADVTAELVDVGAGTSSKDYEGKDVRGKIVLADGSVAAVHRLACLEKGAAGFLSDYPNQTTAWSGDDRDLVRWGHLDPYERANRFAFMVSKRQARDFRDRLERGERILLRARVAAKMVPATYDVVVATIPGTDPSAGEIVLTAHLCHQSAGANDNASGSAAIFEIARALQSGIRKRTLPRPTRTLRFLWVPEIAGSQVYLIRHPEVATRLRAGIHMDMVGGLLATTKGTLHISRTAETLPHVANEIARAWFEEVAAASALYAETGSDSSAGFVWFPGSREPLLADLRPLELGSDHQVFQDSTFAVPMLYFHDWPDVTIHTNKDQPENLDETKLGRVAYMGAGIAWTLAALPETEAPRLLAVARAGAEERIARASAAAGPDAPLVRREAAEAAVQTLSSVAALWPSTSTDAAREGERIRRLAPMAAGGRATDPRIPARNPDIRGPMTSITRATSRRPWTRRLPGTCRRSRRRSCTRPSISRTAGAACRRFETSSPGATAPRRSRRSPRTSSTSRRPAPSRCLLENRPDRLDRLPRAAGVARRHRDRNRPVDTGPRDARARGHALRLGGLAHDGAAPRVTPLATQEDPSSTSYLERELEVRNVAEAYRMADRFDVLHSHWPTPAAYFSDRTARPSVMTYAYIEKHLHGLLQGGISESASRSASAKRRTGCWAADFR